MPFDINEAKKYFIVPFKDQQSLFLLGGKKKLMALEIVMDEKDIVATTGVNLEECYIIVNKTGEEVQGILQEVNKVMAEESDKR